MTIRKLRIINWLRFVALLFSISLTTPGLSAEVCDIDENGLVDDTDIQLIFQDRNQLVDIPIDNRDIDRDAQITIYDARICAACIHDPQICQRYYPIPKADAGPDQSAVIEQKVILNGSGSSNFEGEQLSYHWSLISVPAGSNASLSNPNVPNPSFIVDVGEEGDKYIAELVVSDGVFDSEPDTVDINIGNTAPVANAGPDQSAFVEDLVTLDGSGSTDVNGDLLSYHWTITSKPNGSTASLSDPNVPNPSFVVDVGNEGDVYIVQLIVNDGIVDSAADSVTITIGNIGNTAPVANAGPDQSAFVEDQVILDGSGSTDVNGDLLLYHWSLTSKPDGSTASLSDPSVPNPNFVVDAGKEGDVYIAQLIVNDGIVDSAADTVTINIGNTVPVANAGPDQSAEVKEIVTLDGTDSTDVNGDSLSYLWSLTLKPAGSTASLSDTTVPNPSFIADAGEEGDVYIAQLIVNDGIVDSAADTVTINIGNTAPVANAGPDQSAVIKDQVILDGSGSTDANGDLLSYLWSLTLKPDGSNANLSDPSVYNPSFVVDAGKEGEVYIAQLIVNDGIVDSAADTVTINIGNTVPVANAGPDQSAFVGDTVTLDGSQSFDVNKDPLTYFWSLLSLPPGSETSLSDPAAVNPTLFLDIGGEGTSYVAQLIVNDGQKDSQPDTVVINIQNLLPIAQPDPLICESDPVNLLTKCTNTTTGQEFFCNDPNFDFCSFVEKNIMDNDELGDVPTQVTNIIYNSLSQTVGSTFDTTYGQMTIDSDGHYKYGPNSFSFEQPVTEMFEYTITDVDGDSSASLLSITLETPPPPPSPPVIP